MPKSGSLLIIDDNRQILESLKFLLGFHFRTIETLTNPNLLPSKLKREKFDVYLLDMNFRAGINSGNEGLFWLNEIIKLDPSAVVVMITAYGEVNLAVKAMKSGAADFVLKPWDNDQLVDLMKSALRLNVSKQKLDMGSPEKKQEKDLSESIVGDTDIIRGTSEKMTQLWKTVEQSGAY